MFVVNLIYKKSIIFFFKKNRKTERKRPLPVLPLMKKTKIKKNFNLKKDIKSTLSSRLVVNLI